MKTLYVAPLMRTWEDLGIQLWGIPGTEDMARIKAPEGIPGLLLVFDSMEALKKVYPNINETQVLVIQRKEDG